jgi:hypothetical protein
VLGAGSLFWFDLVLPEVAEEATPASLTSQAAPPREEIAALMKLASAGDVRAIRQRAELLRQRDERLGPFALEVQRRTKAFQIDALHEMLRSYQQAGAEVEAGCSNGDNPPFHSAHG